MITLVPRKTDNDNNNWLALNSYVSGILNRKRTMATSNSVSQEKLHNFSRQNNINGKSDFKKHLFEIVI
jgi:hypothetical protein